MPGKTDKRSLDGHIFSGSVDIEAFRFIANAAITSCQRQGVFDMLGSRRHIEQQTCFTWICLFSEMQSEFAVPERLRYVLEELALRQSGYASLMIINVVFEDACTRQQMPYRYVAFADEGNRLPSGEPCRAR